MVPQFAIELNGDDITQQVAARLVQLRIIDTADDEPDKVEVVVDDQGNEIAWPGRGGEVDLQLGYEGGELLEMGVYTFDEIRLDGPPSKLTLVAKAADFRGQMNVTRSQHWDDVTLGDLVTEIAERNGYTAAVQPGLAAYQYNWQGQIQETDLSFLHRLARELGATFKVAGRHLVFTEPGLGLSVVTQAPLPTVALTPADVTQWLVIHNDHTDFDAVEVPYHDYDKAETIFVRAGPDDAKRVWQMKYMRADHSQALARAVSALAHFQRRLGRLDVTLPGQPALTAETILALRDFRDGINGTWLVKRVEHRLTKSGFMTGVTAELLELELSSQAAGSGRGAGSATSAAGGVAVALAGIEAVKAITADPPPGAAAVDVATWSAATVPTGENLLDVAAVGGRRLAVFDDLFSGASGVLVSDGGAWSLATTPPATSRELVSVAMASATEALALDGAGALFGSDDGGDTWAALPAAPAVMRRVMYLDGQYLGLAGGDIWSSVDRVTWVQLASTTAARLEAVALGGGAWVAVGVKSGGGPFIACSTDDWVTHSERSVPAGFAAAELTGVAFGGGVWVAVGRGAVGAVNIIRSVNGMQWSIASPGPESFDAFDVAWGGGQFVLVGWAGTAFGFPPRFLTSGDGDIWVRRDVPGAHRYSRVVFDQGRFVAVGVVGQLVESGAG